VYRDARIVLAVPAHNERGLVFSMLAGVPDFVDVIVVVDDASTDGTRDEIERAARSDARIHAVSHQRNCGVGAAIVSAFRTATALGADVVAVMDGDGQMHPDDLEMLVAPIVAGEVEFSKGLRFDGVRPRGGMPWTRIAGNLLLSACTKVAAGWRGPLDSQCGYVALSAAAIARLPLDRLYGRYGFPNDLLLSAVAGGLRIRSIPVRSVYGREVSGIRPHIAVPVVFWLLLRGWIRRVLVNRPRHVPAGTTQAIEADEA